MTPLELQTYLHTHIPLSAAMQVKVTQADPTQIELQVPLAPNVNHRGTAFGGSIATLATLAGWSLLRVRLDGMEPLPHLVIQRNTMEFLRPVPGAFSAHAVFPAEADWAGFLESIAAKGKARLDLRAEIFSEGRLAAVLEGVFVALKV